MSGIASSIGLISGIDTGALIDQLIALERRPIDTLEKRVSAIDVQRAAFIELSAQMLALQNGMLGFSRPSSFRQFNAVSSHEEVLTATAGETAAPGNYTFRVRSLVTNHAMISRGFADASSTRVGTGQLTFEVGAGRVNKGTSLGDLRGGQGVRRGVIRITDRGGASAELDLTTATTVDDVLRAINGNSQIEVRARVTGLAANGATGDRIVIEDLSGGTGRLIVEDKGAGKMAADLGIAAVIADDRIDGVDLVRMSDRTLLAKLNDGNGVGRVAAGPDLKFSTVEGDFTVSLTSILASQLDTDLRALNGGNGVRVGVIRVTEQSGKSADIDLSGARTVRDIIEAINAADLSVTATVVNSFFQVSDHSVPPTEPAAQDDEDVVDRPGPSMIIEDVTGSTAADLGLAQRVEDSVIQGRDVYRVATIGDVINAINYAPDNGDRVVASLSADGNGLVLSNRGFGEVTASAVDGSTAAVDLGIDGATFSMDESFQTRRLTAGLNSVLLNSLDGGRGIDAGIVGFTDRAGNSAEIDLSSAQSLSDVIDLINADTATGFVAAVNAAGNGIELRDESGADAGPLSIHDVTGTLAAQLGIAFESDPNAPLAGNVVRGSNAQLQYVNRQTLLSDLNAGRGVSSGSFTITGSDGAVSVVELGIGMSTVGNVIDRINAATPDTIEARINDTGDGILVVDTAAGESPLTIEDREGGRAAADLRLAGTAGIGETSIDGSYEIKIDIDADDTLQDVALKINEAGGGFTAAVLNHGGSSYPYSLTLTSQVSGLRGEMTIDSVGVDLGLNTLSEAQDAVVTIGDDSATNPIVVTSSSNTLDDVIPGVSLDLLSVSDEPVTISVGQDVDSIVESVGRFVDAYNGAIDAIDRDTRFNPDTFERGPLLGDPTVNLLRDRLTRAIQRPFDTADPSMSRLFSVGLRMGEGGRLQFDETRFREAYQRAPESVEALFTTPEKGFGDVFDEVIQGLTDEFDGLIGRKDGLLSDQQELLNNRIESLNVLLQAKRARLEAQFLGLESALAGLQSQQIALSSLAQLAAQ